MRFIKYAVMVAMAFAFCACDEIKYDDRYTDKLKPVIRRAVLVEEFTGQTCQNCPDGHRTISKIVNWLGEDAVIPVCIHAGAQSIPNTLGGLGTTEGENYWKAAGSPSLPSAWFDRVIGPETNRALWQNAVEEQVQKEAGVDINMSAVYSNDSDISIDILLTPKTDIDGSLQLWVVENNVKALQMDGATPIPNYVHNHVFRATVNGQNGTPVSLVKGNGWTGTFSIAKASAWNAENLVIVGFVYNSGGVIQAAQTKVLVADSAE